MRLSGLSLLHRSLVILAILISACLPAAAEGPWSGFWTTSWRDDGGHLRLDQQGERVTGSYPLYAGRIEATAHGRHLEGQWFEGNRSGRFIFVLDRDGNSFAGRYDDGEWWTGARSGPPTETAGFSLASPREAFQQFIVHGNLARIGRPDAWGAAMLAVDFGPAMPAASRTEQLRLVQELFALIDLTTFRMAALPDEATAEAVQIPLEQSGSEARFVLTMLRDGAGQWRIRMPDAPELSAARAALLAARGGRPPAADAYRRMLNPRDTMRVFLEGMADWGGAGRAMALSALDLSALPEVLREAEGMMAAHYLRRALNQIGLVGLQSIPNDGTDRTPYVHFSHPAGRIVIAPSGVEAETPWKLTPQTVLGAARIFGAVEGLPPPLAVPPGFIPDAPYFLLRDAVRVHAPALLHRLGSTEYWQILGGVLVLLCAALIGILVAWAVRRGVIWLIGDEPEQRGAFSRALAIMIGLIFANAFPSALGMPEEIRRFTYPFFGLIFTLSSAIVVWRLFGVLGIVLQRMSDRTATATDDILFTLLLATARLGVVIAAFLGIAHFLSIPTSGILAGLGIGGLAFAFASRETLSNVFGAGILVADRPFKRGDWIKNGEVEGSVEHVGIRSTRVRTAQDSLVVVPNGKLSDSTINNLGTRRHRQVKTQLLVTAGGTPDSLAAFTSAVRERILQDESFVAERTDVGVSGIQEGGIEVEISSYLNVTTIRAELAARHLLLLDVVRLAESCGLILGPGMQPLDMLALAAVPARNGR